MPSLHTHNRRMARSRRAAQHRRRLDAAMAHLVEAAVQKVLRIIPKGDFHTGGLVSVPDRPVLVGEFVSDYVVTHDMAKRLGMNQLLRDLTAPAVVTIHHVPTR